MIDLRSDTVTRPTAAMRAAMAAAEVGDDVYGEDPTVTALEERVADLLGKEAAVFVPSGTMANQLALRVATRPGDAILVHEAAHIRLFEAGAPAVLSGLTVVGLPSRDGLLDPAAAWAVADQSPDDHVPPPSLVAVENTANMPGGLVYPRARLAEIAEGARDRGLHAHCDGARLWNAAIASKCPESALVEGFQSVSVCLSKGLGAPVGSVLAGERGFIRAARRFRKLLGGGMRQAGVIAAAGLHAVEHHRARLADDHTRAARLAAALSEQGWQVDAPQTNMVFLTTPDAGAIVAAARAAGLLLGAADARRVRAVTHLDVSDADVDRAIAVLATLAPSVARG